MIGQMKSSASVVRWTAVLKKLHLKVTEFRIALLETFAKQAKPISAQTLLTLMSAKIQNVDKVTLYRNLEILEEKGTLCRMYFTGQEALYEMRSKDDHHHHLICTCCHKVEDWEACNVPTPEPDSGFKSDHHHLEFYGMCAKCQKIAL